MPVTTDQLETDERAPEQQVSPAVASPSERRARNPREWLRRHPSAGVFLVCFVAVSGILLFKNRQLFTDSIHEDGDFAANSLLMNDAKHFDLLVGNYSRQGFHHPGPAAFYVQAGGEVAFHSVLRVAPTPFDGQAMAILLLYSALVALALMIVYDVTHQRLAVIVAVATVIAFCSAHALVLSSTWMPYYYFAPYFLFIVAAASVAAGNNRHLWCMAIAGGLLVHGHVEFFFFVPVIALAAIVSLVVVGHRRFSDCRRDWIVFGAVIGIFLLPILINVVFHFPGEFGRYKDYSESSKAGGHSIREATNYVLSFWSRDPDNGYAIVALLVGIAALAAVSHPIAAARRFFVGIIAVVALTTAMFIFYAVRGVDDLSQQYIGFFYWAAPMAIMVAAAVGAVGFILDRRRPTQIASLLAIVAVLVAMRGTGLTNDYTGSPNLPAAVSAMAAIRTDSNQPLVMNFDSSAWPDVVGVLVEAKRDGLRACVQDKTWNLVMTDGGICTPDEVARGSHFFFQASQPAVGTLVSSLPFSLIIVGDGPTPT